MARKLRVEFAGACYHVINRGNYRRWIFGNEGRAGSFEKALFDASERYGWQLHAYVVMSNHYHLAVETPVPNLGEGLRWLQATWARRANLYHGVNGRPFQGRYKALLVEPGHALGQVCHYIHLNPVRARLVAPEEAAQYRWSSLNRFVKGGVPSFLTAECFLDEAGDLPETKAGWRKYCQYLAWLAQDDRAQRERAFTRMCQGWCVGSAEFRLAMQAELLKQSAEQKREVSLRAATVQEVRDLREAQWEAILAREASRLDIDLAKFPAKKSAPEKVRLAAVMRAISPVSNGWLAKRLNMGKPASVSQYVRRFSLETSPEIC